MKKQNVIECIAEVFETEDEEIASNSLFQELEIFDSVVMLALMVALDDELGIKVSHEMLPKLTKLDDVIEIANKQGLEIEE